MNLLNEPTVFSKENIEKIEKLRNAKWVIDTENPKYSNIPVAIFYQEEAYPETDSHYFGLYKAGQLMITDGSWIESTSIDAREADNGDVIFSRYRHGYVTSPDGTVMIDGGRAYTRCSQHGISRVITVKDGVVSVS